MVRGSGIVEVISRSLSEMLVCPLSKQTLRVCQKSNSLISDAIAVSFPIVDGIPCLVPKDGKIIEAPSDEDGDLLDTKRHHQDGTSS